MIVLEIDLAQKAVAFAPGRDVLHFRGTDRREVLAAVVDERVIHPGTLKVRQGRRALAPNTIPVISGSGFDPR